MNQHDGGIEEALTILIIDENPLVHNIVNWVLSKQYHVEHCSTGKEALHCVQQLSPSLILLDETLPDMDGFEVLRSLKRLLQDEVPILVLTNKSDLTFEAEAIGLGAVDYINKPFTDPLLKTRVEIHLAHTMQRRRLEHYNAALQAMVRDKVKIIRELQNAIVYTLADLVEMRDTSTGGHVKRTQAYFQVILEYLDQQGLYQEELSVVDHSLLLEASQLHDIGKVAIPDAILCKPGRLTAEEFDIMKTHAAIGHQAIVHAMDLTTEKDFLSFAAPVALYHHEKWNGKGYPCGLAGEEIPLPARIMAIVDVYDALVSNRHYKPRFSHEEAMQILQQGRGTDFDPVLMDAVVAVNERFSRIRDESV